MKVLVDIGHPAHVHFFHHPIRLLTARGHEVLITSRDKDVALDLLRELDVEHRPLSVPGRGLLGFARELAQRDFALWRVAREFQPAVMAEIGGTFIAHVGRLTGIPSLAFYDTENATLQNAITYPLASCVFVPRCYTGWVPRNRHVRYAGYHELSYLHPHRFRADRDIAIENGLDPTQDNFFVRLVSWRANHDVGERGWTRALLDRLVSTLAPLGHLLISSEARLTAPFDRYTYRGKVSAVHHVMAFCRAYVGESATMASEAAVLGVPAIYAAHTGRGYTTEQEVRYGLVRNVHRLDWPGIQAVLNAILAAPRESWMQAQTRLLEDTVDVAAYVMKTIETFPTPLRDYQRALSG